MPSSPLRRAAILAIAAAGLAAVSGCGLASPTVTTRPYVASNGANADLPLPDGTRIAMRNFVVVLEKAGGTGQVVGAVTYTGQGTLEFAIEAKNTAQVNSIEPSEDDIAANGSAAPVQPSVAFDVTGGELTQVGPTGVPFILPVVKVGPGQYVDLTASSPATGSITWQVPVVAAVGDYAGLTATTTSAPSSKPSPSPTETPAEDAETTTTSP